MEQSGLVFSEAIGGFDAPGTGKDRVVTAWLVFILLQIITSIIVLNTLIAILGDSYDNVQNDAIAYDMRQKA